MNRLASLPDLEAADAIGDAEDLGGVDRQRLERLVAVHAPRHRHRGVVGQDADVGAVAGGERDLDARVRRARRRSDSVAAWNASSLAGSVSTLPRMTGMFFSLSRRRRRGASLPPLMIDLHLHALGERHRVADVLRAVRRCVIERQLPFDDRHERLEDPVDGLVRARLLA